MSIEKISVYATVVALLLVSVAFASAEPSAPTSFSTGLTTTFDPNNYQLQTHDASAGNITALVVTGVSQTHAWQGYYGNITGTITLDDASNFTFYNWSATEPRGEVYATLSNSVSWQTVDCFDFGGNTDLNETVIENYYAITVQDTDGIAETYAATNHPLLTVGSSDYTGCPTAYVNQNDAAQSSNFVNVLLWDYSNNNTGWIYTTVIENKTDGASTQDLICYNGQECDFQLLVNEDGHNQTSAAASTTYYFWVELS